jgi:type II secretory pathway predicted ATPase ExeA
MDAFSPKIAPSPAPFSGFPAGGFFYASVRIEDTLTSVCSYIETRRGLAVIIGEAGSGKTALLNKIAANLSADVIPIRASNPRLNFAGVLQLIQRNLGKESPARDEAALLAICKFHLRARMHNQQIFVLILDNAHHLAESTLMRLTQSFAPAGPQDCDGHLLPVILAGRPQLKTTLLQAAQSFPSQRPLICELGRLQGFDVASYIEQGLRAADLPPELFEPGAVTQIALSSHGNPARINALCDRAFQIVSGQSGGNITADLIQAVAKDLNMSEAQPEERGSAQEKITDATKEVDSMQFQLGGQDSTEVVGETFLQYSRSYDRDRRLPSRRINTGLTLGASLLLLAAAASVWNQAEPGASPLAHWSKPLSALLPALRQFTAPPNNDDLSEPTVNSSAAPRKPTETLSAPQDGESTAMDDVQPETGRESPSEPAAKTVVSSEEAVPARRAPTQMPNRPPTQPNAAEQREHLEAKIIQAISNRAIMGVGVSVVQGTAILEGHVASERQRRAAERAARSVEGIERVRNRIIVSFG